MKKLSVRQYILIALLVLSFIGIIVVWPFSMDIVSEADTLQKKASSHGEEMTLFEAMRSLDSVEERVNGWNISQTSSDYKELMDIAGNTNRSSMGAFIARLVICCALVILFVVCVILLKKLKYLLLTIGALIMVFPFYWMIASSFKTATEMNKFPPTMAPASWTSFVNYGTAWTSTSLGRSFVNSLIVVTSSVALVTFTTILAAFAFSRLKFPGRDVLFTLLLSMMMVPFELLIITNRQTIISFGLSDTLAGLVIPFTSSIFYTYILRNFFMSVPESLYQSSQVDGSSNWQYLWKVMVPIARPSLVTIVLLNAMASWNSFMWPQVVINNTIKTNSTLPLALSRIGGEVERQDNVIMAGATITVLPMLLLFLFARKQIVRGVARGGIKG